MSNEIFGFFEKCGNPLVHLNAIGNVGFRSLNGIVKRSGTLCVLKCLPTLLNRKRSFREEFFIPVRLFFSLILLSNNARLLGKLSVV